MLIVSLILFALFDSVLSFRILAIFCATIGSTATVWYVIQIKEVPLSKRALELDEAYKSRMKSGKMLNVTNLEKKEKSGGKSPTEWMKEC